jgi:histone acetyltransferase (RNA polymerase elongator complex component)
MIIDMWAFVERFEQVSVIPKFPFNEDEVAIFWGTMFALSNDVKRPKCYLKVVGNMRERSNSWQPMWYFYFVLTSIET